MKANRKFREGEEAVSAVIGVILMVAITVAIAATVYVYVSGIIGPGTGATPSVSITAAPSGGACIITVGTPTQSDIQWADCWYNLVNISSASAQTDSTVVWPTTTMVRGGDIISISNALADNAQYRLTLVYNSTGGTMGTVTWTQ